MTGRVAYRTVCCSAVSAVLFGLIGCQEQPLPRVADVSATAPVVACTANKDTDRRFEAAENLLDAGDLPSARAALELLLADCDPSIRNRALNRLTKVAATNSPENPHKDLVNPASACPGPKIWVERFAYVDQLEAAPELLAARIVLEEALSDCDDGVRRQAADHLRKLPLPPVPDWLKCPDSSIWKERFTYAVHLQAHGMVEGARAILSLMLEACNESVRADALKALLAIPPPPGQPPASCAGAAVWQARFHYADRVLKSGDITGARTVLVPALADCDPTVRGTAEAKLFLTHRRSWLASAKSVVESDFGDVGKILAKAGVAIVSLIPLLLLILVGAVAYNRNRVRVEPLTVFGLGLDGAYFVSIARFIAAEMEEMRTANPNGIVSPRGTTIAENAGNFDAMATAAQALAGDSAGKLIAALFSFLDRPRYRCIGTARLDGNQAEIMVQIKKGRAVIGNWERSSTTANMIEDLKDLAYLALLKASHAMHGRS